jgi:hypothetical protein
MRRKGSLLRDPFQAVHFYSVAFWAEPCRTFLPGGVQFPSVRKTRELQPIESIAFNDLRTWHG